METLSDDQIRTALDGLPGWEGAGPGIHAGYDFDSFRDAIAFVNRVADLAEQAQHHPDLHIGYDHVDVELTTHSAGGVTQKDVDLAHQVDAAS